MAELRLTVIRSTTLLAGAALIAAAPAFADSASLFRDGRFTEAAAAGQREATPAGEVIAARSLLAVAAYRTTDKDRALALIDQAGKLAGAAQAANPRDTGALLQQAIATGYRAKLKRDPDAGKAARRMMEQARTQEPGNALAWASLGGWHGETVATLSAFLAATIMGAKKADCIANFDKALALDPRSATYPIFYAQTLLAMDTDNAPRAKDLLTRALSLPTRDGYDALLKAQARELLPVLQQGDAAAIKALAKRQRAFGTFNEKMKS